MRQTCCKSNPKKRYFDSRIEFDKCSFIKHNKFNSKIIDSILNDVEKAIISAPNEYKNSENKTLDMFSDLLYDTTGFLRLIRFIQYGAFYVITVYDHVTNHFFYLAYSIYDIIDNFTSDSSEKVSYIKLAESAKDYKVNVSCVKDPKQYSGERQAINEYNKYIVTIGDENMVLHVTQQLICVSQVYRKVNDTNVSEKIAGEVTFKIGEYEINKAFSYDPMEIDNTEYQEMFNEIDENIINTYAPYGIAKWYCRDLVGYETSKLEGVLTRNGSIKFEAVLAEKPTNDDEESDWNDDINSNEDFPNEPSDDEPGTTGDEGGTDDVITEPGQEPIPEDGAEDDQGDDDFPEEPEIGDLD